MINTCSYKNFNTELYKGVSVSGNRGKDVGYCGACYQVLAPKRSFWETWHENIGILSEEENTKYYIEQYYLEVLSKLDPEEIYRELDCSFLLCYEDSMEFCHRHIIAAWLEILLNIEVSEVKVNGLYIERVERPSYIKEYLEEIMKTYKDMRGFNSLCALYLFEQSEELEKEASLLEETTGDYFDELRQEACFLRSQADEEEEKYKFIRKKTKYYQ